MQVSRFSFALPPHLLSYRFLVSKIKEANEETAAVERALSEQKDATAEAHKALGITRGMHESAETLVKRARDWAGERDGEVVKLRRELERWPAVVEAGRRELAEARQWISGEGEAAAIKKLKGEVERLEAEHRPLVATIELLKESRHAQSMLLMLTAEGSHSPSIYPTN